MGRLVTTATLVLGAVFLAGCSASIHIGSSRTVDSASIGDAITQKLQDQNPGLHVDSIACPKDLKPVEGLTFQCTAKFEGTQAPFTVTLSHVNTSTGEYNYNSKPAKAVLDSDKAVKVLKSRLHDQAPNATVDCGTARWRVVEVGGAIECTIVEGDKPQVVRLVVEDVGGTVHFEQS